MSQWYTIHCAACQGHDFIGRPCRGRQIPLQPDDGFWFTVDSLAAALVEVEESKLDPRCIADQCDHGDDDPRCMDTSLGCGDAAAIIKAAKEASE